MAITLNANTIHLAGNFITKGKKAPNFHLVQTDLSEFCLNDKINDYLILNIFPSLDTNTCASSVRKFNKIASEVPGYKVLCISKDLPFAHNRFCVSEGIENVITLSDFRYDSDFGIKYGLLITDGPLKGLLARAVIIIHPKGEILYTQLVPEISHEPNYEEIISFIKSTKL